MILKQLQSAFDQEADVLKEALSLEREKTPAILNAEGMRLKELSARSDQLLADLSKLEDDRHLLFQSFTQSTAFSNSERPATIDSFMQALAEYRSKPDHNMSFSDWGHFLDDLIVSISHFRDTANSLKQEVSANQQLLHRTRRVIQGIMTDLEKPSPAYSPDGKAVLAKPKTTAGPLVLNTNA